MVSLIFVLLAGVCWGILQTLMWHPDTNILSKKNPKWWNPNISYKNKYNKIDGVIPPYPPKFFGSTTFLAWTTDGWHLVDKIFLTCIFLSIVLYKPWINIPLDFIIYYLVFTITFELVWRKLKVLTKLLML